MKAIVQKLDVGDETRVIAISDIHGNLEVFQKLLRKVDLCKDDILILLGDIIEKGPKNLQTLHYIMELTAKYQVYPILGNCDMVLLNLFTDEENDRLKEYLLTRRSTIHDMYELLGYKIDLNTDIMLLKKRICENYHKELVWLKNLPHIITAGKYYFAHAAFKSDDLSVHSIQDVIAEENFLLQDHKFEHTIVVGHMPAVFYQYQIPIFNPIIDRNKNIICIDGGNVLKSDGQLNALIIENVNSDDVKYEYMDLLPRAIIKDNSIPIEPQDSLNVTWGKGAVEILETKNEFSLCQHRSTGRSVWVLSEVLYMNEGQLWTDEATNYILPVAAGDEVSVVRDTTRGYYIKKDGIAGWYHGKLEYIKS